MTSEVEPKTFSPAEIDHNVGREAFTALEEYMKGSTAPTDGLKDPLRPHGILRGLSVEAVIAIRQEQVWFSSFMGGEMNGLDSIHQVPLFTMVELNGEGVVVDYPKLYGIWDRRTRQVDRSKETLASHELKRERFEEILAEIKSSL